MLSILIPIYNFNVVKLVDNLKKQCDKLKIEYQILCFDDISLPKYKEANSVLSDYFNVNYTSLSEKLGRSRIRNWLIKSAAYDHLLFLDCDSKVISKSFIKNYLDQKDKADVLVGGRVYSKKPPRAKSKQLHWLYGSKKESKAATYRNKYPLLYFHSNNFLAKSKVFKGLKFDEHTQGYGYEDLMLGKVVQEKGFSIKHIDNPVEHLGVEKSKVFLEKTDNALKNLIQLHYSENALETHLIRFANRIQDWGFKEDFLQFFEPRMNHIKENLISPNPSLIKFNVYKLFKYFKLKNEYL